MEHSQERWNQLAVRLKAGDHNAAAELVDAYYTQICLFFRRLGHNRQTSEDMTQETFFQAWQHISQLRSHVLLRSWLYRIASNVSSLHWRHLRNEKLSGLNTNTELDAATETAFSEQAENAEQLGLINQVITNLPEKLKQAVVLHYMQELTIEEAADALGIWQGTYKSRLNRALKIIKNELNKVSKD